MENGIELGIYSYDDILAAVPKWIVPGRKNPTALEEVSGNGGGGFWISKKDPKFVADNDLVDGRNMCKVKVNGDVIHAFLLGEREATIIGSGEKAEEGYSLVGQGLKSWFDDAEVYPYGGIKPESAKNRFFNFATERGAWYNTSSWVAPINNGTLFTGPWKTYPAKWPDAAKHAKWIWGAAYSSPASYVPCYFRWEITLAAAGQYAIYVSADDEFILWVDGAKTAESNPSTSSWYEASRIEVTLSAGPHVLAYRAKNRNAPGYFGPAALASALFKVGFEEQETLIGVSDTSAAWKVLPFPSTVPGWSVGEVLIKLLDEAEARGIRFPTYLNPTFTATHDSYGVAWTDRIEWSFSVGESYASVLQKIEELYDVWIDPVNLNLNMAPVRGTTYDLTHTNPIKLKVGHELRSAKTMVKAKIKNAMLMDTADGWSQVSDAASVAKYGRIETAMKTESGAAFSSQIAQMIFAQRATEEEGATYEFIPTNKIPWVHFRPGDWLLAPNDKGVSVKRRVMSIALEESEAGQPFYAIEFDTIFRDNESRMERILAKLGGGGAAGGLSNAGGIVGGGGGGSITLPPINTPVVRYPKPPTSLVADSIGYWSANGVNPLSEVELDWNPVTQYTDDTAVVPDHYEVTAKNISVPDTDFVEIGRTSATNMVVTGYIPGTQWTFRVYAVDAMGSRSAYAETSEVMVGPTAPMIAPHQPVNSTQAGLLTMTWDGLFLGATTPPPQFRYLYAEVKPNVGGTWTRMGPSLARDGRQITVPGLTVGSQYLTRFTAVDGAGVLSDISAVTGPTTIVGIVTADIPDVSAAVRKAGEQINLFGDSSFEANTAEFWTLAGGATNVTTAPYRGTRHLSFGSSGVAKQVLAYNTIFEGDPGDSFLFRVFLKATNAAAVTAVGGVELSIEYGATSALGSIAVVALSGTLELNEYLQVAGNWEIPDNVKYFRPRVRVVDLGTTAVWHLDDARLFRMTGVDDIVTGSITTDKIAADAVTAVEIAAQAITAGHIQAASITGEHIAAAAITAANIAAGAIEANAIAAGAIQVGHVSPLFGQQINLDGNVQIVSALSAATAAQTAAETTADSLSAMQTYYDFGPTGAIISSPGSVFATAVRSDRIEMLENGNVISYWNSGALYVNQFIGERVTMGNHQFEKYGTGTVMRAL